MKSINNTFSLLAVAMLTAGVANAQGPTNTYQGPTIRPVATPGTAPDAPADVPGASKGTYSPNYGDYSQDSYVNQVGNHNTASVDQSDNRASKAGGGSTAILDQIGDYNTANQTQTLATTPSSQVPGSTGGRDFMKATQLGSNSQSDQTQHGGGYNSAIVNQGVGTTGNRAIQTQNIDGNGIGDGNQATINQTRYTTVGGGSGNHAEQTQSGINQIAKVDQESSNSYASQTQSGGSPSFPLNNAYIHQGDPGNANTAVQTQNGTGNIARIQQSVGSIANNNYAEQGQMGTSNRADIEQRSSKNYAEQQQQGTSNYASTLQESVQSASYITQNGVLNSAIVHQH